MAMDLNKVKTDDEDLIPANAFVKTKIKIKAGFHDDASKGWTDGYVTRNDNSGNCYLMCQFIVTEGKYKGRSFWDCIGLYSKNSPKWAEWGMKKIRAIIESIYRIMPSDNSKEANETRNIEFDDLEKGQLLTKVGIKEDEYGKKNMLLSIITPDKFEYSTYMEATDDIDKNIDFADQLG